MTVENQPSNPAPADPAPANPAPSPAPADPANPAPAPADPAKPAAPADLLDDEPAPADPAAPKPADPAAEQPIAYTDFKLPEGVDVDKDALGKLTAFAQGKKLTQDEAQGLVDMAAEMRGKWEQGQRDTVSAVHKAWRESAEKDPEYGGAQLKDNMLVARKGRDAFASDELKTMLKESGLGNNPEFIRFFFRVGKAVSEDKILTGAKNRSESGLSLEQRAVDKLYPT